MIAFDTDVLSRLLHGDRSLLTRAAKLEPGEQSVPIVVLEEIMRGRLSSIRRAESRRTETPLEHAYELFERTFTRLRHVAVLSYGAAAHEQFQDWRRQKLRLSTHDLRIAAICVAETATLATCNRRDFERVPDLTVEFWE
jgi:predicted nucleic acid-binding protein